MVYKWAPGYHAKVPAEVAGQALAEMYDETGHIEAPAVVRAASDVDHPLHPGFEWDDAVAANEHRILQARQLVNSLRVVATEIPGAEPERVYISVRSHEVSSGPNVYMALRVVERDADYRQEEVQRGLKALENWMERFGHYEELAPIAEVLRSIQEPAEENLPQEEAVPQRKRRAA